MNERMKKYVALSMLINLVDANNGTIHVGTDKVRKVFSDSNDVVKIEYVSGEVGLLADADYDTMNNAVLKWKNDNPTKFSTILNGLKR